MSNLFNPCPPMRGRTIKLPNGRKDEVVNAYREAETGNIRYKAGRKWYTLTKGETDANSDDKG